MGLTGFVTSGSFRLALPKQESSIAPDDVYTNSDTDPTLAQQRLWGPGTVIMYWFSDVVGISAWETASSVISVGLDWKQALVVKVVGSVLLSIPLVLNGRVGALLHVPFPILIRASHGYYFSLFPVISRAVIAILWFGVVSWNGASCVKLLITAIWPSFAHLKNRAAADAGYTTVSMVSYFIYWCIQFPIIFIHPSRLKYILAAKSVATPIVAIATLAWCLKQAGASGGILSQQSTLEGSAYAKQWLLALASTIGGYSTLALNIPDFTRYTKSPNVSLVQAPLLPFLYFISALFGTFAAASTQVFHGSILWSPLDISTLWLTSSGGRAAAFFAALAWMIANISTNVSSNSISAANDMSTLLPKYINIRRGQIITALVGPWCMVPWKILTSGTVFLSFMSGYAFVLGPFAGVMLCDYYLVKKGKYDVPGLYDPHGSYRYRAGVNWRAVVSLVISIAPCFPGFLNVLNAHIVVGRIAWLYRVAWIYGILSSSICYWLLNRFFPDTTGSLIDHVIYASDSEKFRAWEASQSIKEKGSSVEGGEVELGGDAGSDLNEKGKTDLYATEVIPVISR